MSKLSPKPTDKNPKKSWKDLDSTLQAYFKLPGKSVPITIDIDTYEMTAKELVEEAKKAGYTIDVVDDEVINLS
ncbi:hypothetical protein [Streptococcus phocae]|uniref:Uncharacterized protein n=1 Tax=Streptococcus phocae TaxID=119224 RepID=A0A0N8FX05_9STRE|nr:hypothetical protein [Streptococcus phocae]KPJ21787.1 hypothetical protein AKK44_07895 [Streptococcus phocae]